MMDSMINEYILKCRQQANEYEVDILSGHIIANQWMLSIIKREQELRKKYNYIQEKVDSVYKFFSFNKLSNGKQYELMPWQCWLIKCVYGLYREDNQRLRTEALLFISKKNGKSDFAARLGIYSLMKDNQGFDNQVYFVAVTVDQARIAFNYCKSAIYASKAISKRVRVLRDEIKYGNTSIIKALPATLERLDGKKPTFVIVDEPHSHPTRELYTVMSRGMVSKGVDQLLFECSTAGFSKTFPFFQIVENRKEQALKSTLPDSYFAAIYCIDGIDDVNDISKWVKANPSIGYILDLEDLKKAFENSKIIPSERIAFEIKQLNYYADALVNEWISVEQLAKVSEKINLTDYQGYKCWVGLDLSKTTDFTALSLCFEHNGKTLHYIEYHLPNNPEKLIRKTSINVQDWIDNQLIIKHPSKTIDYNIIYNRIIELSKIFKIVNIGYDPFYARELVMKLEEASFKTTQCKQTLMFFSTPMKAFEKQVIEEQVIVDSSPVTLYNFMNVRTWIDPNSNIRPDKTKSKDSIDGVIALLNAYGTYLNDRLSADKERSQAQKYYENLKKQLR